jgi:hypothetical protein
MSTPDQWRYGNPWTYAPRDTIVGNHCIYILGYDQQYLYCISWGKLQRMTWEYWDKMCTECYAIIDSPNPWLGAESPINISECQRLLSMIQSIPPESIASVQVTVVDKKGVPVKDCQVCVFKDDVVAQTYAYTDKNGLALFAALPVGETFQFTVEYQAADRRATLPITVTKTVDPKDAASTAFQFVLPIDYVAGYERGTLVL